VSFHLNGLEDPRQALTTFCHALLGRDALGSHYQPVGSKDLPDAYRRLLVHDQHMTLRLREHFGEDVVLHVLANKLDSDVYQRHITLTLEDSDRVVEIGLVRIDLGYTKDAVRSAILERKAPLGDVLIQANVLRRIEPKWYYRFAADCPILADFGNARPRQAYGRLGVIYCDEQPAIELLEIVYDERVMSE
jgi:chorismate-pyruvate lyase